MADFDSLDNLRLSGKARVALKRQIRYRTDETYRQKVREKAEKSKQREEYKESQRDYNRNYYQRVKEKLKERRESSKKNASLQISREEGAEITEEEGVEITEDDGTIYVQETIVDGDPDNNYIVEDVVKDEELEEEEREADVEEEQMFFCGVVEKEEVVKHEIEIEYHSYPRARSPISSRKRRRGVEKSVQADMDGDEDTVWQRESRQAEVVQLVDVGIQVCQTDLMLHQEDVYRLLEKD